MPYYVTTPIYYVNSKPHIGHAYTTIAADILVRHYRQRGEDTFFLTGVDEHASKVARVAEEQGLAPKEYADRIVGAWQEVPRRIEATNDFFIRTTDEGHKAFVADFLQRIYDAGDIYEDVYAGLYCVGCEAFKTESEIVDGKCPLHDTEPEWIEEKNWFFRLSAYQERLVALYEERPDFVQPGFRYNEARSFIASGLQDFSISRAGQPWGVAIPWDPEQVAYVWADALVNYLSALTYARPGEDLRDRYWPSVRHLIGKDIIRFHCVFWPAMLLSAGYEVPHQIFVHGSSCSTTARSRSRSGTSSTHSISSTSTEPIPSGSGRCEPSPSVRTARCRSSLHERYERELANDLGNLVSRTTAMVDRFLGGELPESSRADSPVAALVEGLADDVARRFDAFDLTGALERIWVVVRGLNRHVEAQAPWQLAKEDKRDELQATLYDLADGIRVIAIALASYVPDTSARILEALGEDADEVRWERVVYGLTGAKSGIAPAAPLFPRIDSPTVTA